MDLPRYFADVAADLQRKSQSIRRDFATHRGTAGDNRESVLAKFLRDHLPGAFDIDAGLIASCDGQFSNEADLIVVDRDWNCAFYPDESKRIWLVEAVFALIEVKTSLTPTEIGDAVGKCRRFKTLPRQFSEAPAVPRLKDSLFVLWGFDSPSSETLKNNLQEAFQGVPVAERPDFVVVPGKVVAMSGSYMELAKLGEPGSDHRKALQKQYGPDLVGLPMDLVQLDELGDNALFAWLIWVISWLKRAGPRNSELMAYLPKDRNFGRRL